MSEGAKIAYSPNGINWTAVTDIYVSLNCMFTDITWGDNKFVAVCFDGKILYSSDGITWTVKNNILDSFLINGITWGNDKFIAVGSGDGLLTQIAYSLNGVDWIKVNGVVAEFQEDEILIPYCAAWGNNKFVVGSEYGIIIWSTGVVE